MTRSLAELTGELTKIEEGFDKPRRNRNTMVGVFLLGSALMAVCTGVSTSKLDRALAGAIGILCIIIAALTYKFFFRCGRGDQKNIIEQQVPILNNIIVDINRQIAQCVSEANFPTVTPIVGDSLKETDFLQVKSFISDEIKKLNEIIEIVKDYVQPAPVSLAVDSPIAPPPDNKAKLVECIDALNRSWLHQSSLQATPNI